jgi:hypothetical protein
MLASMNIGDITGVLRTPRGYQILKLESRTESKARASKKHAERIANRIGDQRLRGEREKYLDRLRGQATITWRNTDLKNAYETVLARRRQASGLNAMRRPRTEARTGVAETPIFRFIGTTGQQPVNKRRSARTAPLE